MPEIFTRRRARPETTPRRHRRIRITRIRERPEQQSFDSAIPPNPTPAPPKPSPIPSQASRSRFRKSFRRSRLLRIHPDARHHGRPWKAAAIRGAVAINPAVNQPGAATSPVRARIPGPAAGAKSSRASAATPAATPPRKPRRRPRATRFTNRSEGFVTEVFPRGCGHLFHDFAGPVADCGDGRR